MPDRQVTLGYEPLDSPWEAFALTEAQWVAMPAWQRHELIAHTLVGQQAQHRAAWGRLIADFGAAGVKALAPIAEQIRRLGR